MWDRIKNALRAFMYGRRGVDELSMFCIIVGLLLGVINGFLGIGLLGLISFALYAWALFRMYSRNLSKRAAENARYQALFSTGVTKLRQFWTRTKNRKEYKYFRCPGCRSLMRLKRGSGPRHIVCPKCHRDFDQHA